VQSRRQRIPPRFGRFRKAVGSVYSSGPLGRLVAEDVIGMVAYLKSKA
jgi:hypothetical protein